MKVSASEAGSVTGTRANEFKEKGSDEEPKRSVSGPTDVGGAAAVYTKNLYISSGVKNHQKVKVATLG